MSTVFGPSSIENSPNSLGEAQLLGVPCIASDVGGVTDMIPNKECGIIYRFEEVELLAKHIPSFSICVKDVRMLKIEENNDLMPAIKAIMS